MSMCKVVSFYSLKGGVGKTSACVNTAFLSSRSGLRTLLIDLDPQGSGSYYLRVHPKESFSSSQLSQQGEALEACIRESDYPLLDILPADFSLTHLTEDLLQTKKKSVKRLSKVFAPLREAYERIYIDTPATFDLLSRNVMYTSDLILIPLVPTTLSLLTYERLKEQLISEKVSCDQIATYVSMLDRRKRLHIESAQRILGMKECLGVSIPNSSDVERMGMYREPVYLFSRSGSVKAAFEQLQQQIETYLRS